jgi:hypothetical protein
MSYDNVNNFVETFAIPGLTNATLVGAFRIRVPTHKGVRFAAIEDVKILQVGATAIVNTTTPGQVQIGTPTAPGKFVAQPISGLTGLALGQTYGCADVDGRVAAYSPASGVSKGCIDLAASGDGDAQAAQRDLLVSTLAGVGTPAGTFAAFVTVRWF